MLKPFEKLPARKDLLNKFFWHSNRTTEIVITSAYIHYCDAIGKPARGPTGWLQRKPTKKHPLGKDYRINTSMPWNKKERRQCKFRETSPHWSELPEKQRTAWAFTVTKLVSLILLIVEKRTSEDTVNIGHLDDRQRGLIKRLALKDLRDYSDYRQHTEWKMNAIEAVIDDDWEKVILLAVKRMEDKGTPFKVKIELAEEE